MAVGAVAFVNAGPRKILHTVGLADSPDHHVSPSDWPIISQVIESAAMQRQVPWAISVPPEGATGVVVCLHGRNDDHRFAFDAVHLHDVVHDIAGSWAVVGVDGGASSYWHARADGTDAQRMVLDELLPAVDAYLGSTLPRSLLGWSMGGYGALLAAEQAPDRFVAVAAASPALWHEFADASTGAFDSAEDFDAHDVFAGSSALDALVARVDCGTDDEFESVARSFAATIRGGNPGGFTAGFHDREYWRSIAPAQLATLGAAMDG